MSEAELVLVEEAKNCTLYTILFLSEDDNEFEKFFNKFKDDVEFNPDLMRMVGFLGKIADFSRHRVCELPGNNVFRGNCVGCRCCNRLARFHIFKHIF